MVAELDGQVLVEVSDHESRHFVLGLFLVAAVIAGALRARTKKITEAVFGNCHAEFTLSGHEILRLQLRMTRSEGLVMTL